MESISSEQKLKNLTADIFNNPKTGENVNISIAWLWTLLFGSFYFMFKGNWKHFFISFFAACFTAGISWLIYPFFAKKIMRNYYLEKGWNGA